MPITLNTITRDTWRACLDLHVAPDQVRFIPPNAESLAQASAQTEHIAVLVAEGGTPSGFAMYARAVEDGEWWIERFMVDHRRQRRGIGRAALEALLGRMANEHGCRRVFAGIHPENAAALALCAATGFVPTGAHVIDEEVFCHLLPESDADDSGPSIRLSHRPATLDDCHLLAGLNLNLIRDEGHTNPMTPPELERRMRGWLESGEYRAVLFFDAAGATPVAYALYRESADGIHLRQYFVARERRRQGIGRAAIEILRRAIWPPRRRLTVDVLAHNAAGVTFWRAVGYGDYALTLEIPPFP